MVEQSLALVVTVFNTPRSSYGAPVVVSMTGVPSVFSGPAPSPCTPLTMVSGAEGCGKVVVVVVQDATSVWVGWVVPSVVYLHRSNTWSDTTVAEFWTGVNAVRPVRKSSVVLMVSVDPSGIDSPAASVKVMFWVPSAFLGDMTAMTSVLPRVSVVVPVCSV